MLLVLVMLIGLMPVTVFASEIVKSGTCGNNLTWTLDDEGTLTISGTGDMTNFQLSYVPWYNEREKIYSIVILDGVTSIGVNAFNSCSNLSEINISSSVTTIAASAFAYCINIAEITIPQNVTHIYTEAFKGCTSLIELTIPQNVTHISSGAFKDCTSLEELTMPKDSYGENGASRFGYIFGYQTKVVTMRYGYYDTRNTINGSYFYPSVRYPDIDDTYTSGSEVPECTVYQNYNYTYTSSQESETSAYFVNCYSHRVYVYYCIPASLKKVTITNDTAIDESAFYNCTNIEEIVLNDEITSIGDNSFYNCTATIRYAGDTEISTETPIEQPTETPTVEPTEQPTEKPSEVPTETATPTPVVDKTALTTAISNAKAINEEKYTESSYSALLAAIATAEDVLADESATAEDVENAKVAIETAISLLELKSTEPVETDTPTEQPSESPSETPEPTETTAPTEMPSGTPTVEPTEEPTETPTTEPTEQPTATPTVEPTEIPTEQPTETPTPAPVVDKSALTNAISNAKAINADKYTESSYSALSAAITTAENVLADENATAEDVENARLTI